MLRGYRKGYRSVLQARVLGLQTIGAGAASASSFFAILPLNLASRAPQQAPILSF